MDPESINSVFALFDYYGDILYELLIAGSWTRCYQSDAYEAFAGGLMNRGKRAFILGEQRKKGQILRGSKTILGNREHKKTNFEGTEEQANLFQRNKGTGNPHLERASHIAEAIYYHHSKGI